MSMNPRETTEKIRNDYTDYLASILSVKDQNITSLARDIVRNTEFVKGPYLETTLPFEDGKTLKDLAENENLLSREFKKMGKSVHYEDWKLRIHQEDALKHIIEKERNMVVATGTGSGKTECYLYPIFNSLMREKEAGTLDAGVRALLIFPMNALANDQQKKLRKLLKNYPDITFGRYTGETEHKRLRETPEEAEKRLHQEYDASHIGDTDEAYRKSINNEMMCREMMAKKPPHILLTNYAMLEYMLLRPDTAPFFDNSSAKNWQFIVIDEAHTYRGATGTEIAFLLRRLKERIRHYMDKPFRCIATSATLGSEDGKSGLAKFAENIFGEPFDESDIIMTTRKERIKPKDGRLFTPKDYVDIRNDCQNIPEAEKGAALYDSLCKDLRLFRVYEALRSKPRKIEDVANVVFDDIELAKDREFALIDLIELAAAAKKSDFEAALLPARYHLFIKSLEGMFIQYYPKKRVFLDRKEKICEEKSNYSVYELANCQKCGQEYLVGKTAEYTDGSYFVQTSSTDKPEYYLVSNEDEEFLSTYDEDDTMEENEKIKDLEAFNMCLCCGSIKPIAETHTGACCKCTDSSKIVKVYKLNYSGKNNESNCCPCCGATKAGLIKRFLTANQPATFAIAKSLYDAIPPRPVVGVNVNHEDDLFSDDIFEDDIFGDEHDGSNASDIRISDEINDESGRKLLIFSDNRQEAAFFAGYFDKRYNLIMWRKAILQCLKQAENGQLYVPDLIGRIMNIADRAGLYPLDVSTGTMMTDDQKRKMAAHYVMQEFISPDIEHGLEGLGYIQIEPEPQNLRENATVPGLDGVTGDVLWNLFRFMMDTLRQKGANNYPEDIRATDDFFAPRNHIGYFRQSGAEANKREHIYGFLPKDKAPNKRYSLINKLVPNGEENDEERRNKVKEILNYVYTLILRLKSKNYIIETQDSARGTVYCLNYAKWRFRYVKPGDTLYKCDKCGKVFGYSIKDKCPEMKCVGTLIHVKANEIQKEPYYMNLFADSKFIPMEAREHTAQLSTKTAGEYQKDFEEGKINVLSCSTTFEMGVDVGELEATFQRNVPPETSNYIQRAGRAGRRTSSAAFSVTFSRRNSHDMTFYHDPALIIAGKISPPILEIDNEKIAERHLNSIVVAWFFKRYPEFFNGNAKRIVSYSDEDNNMSSCLRDALESRPSELLESIHNVLPEDICQSLKVDEWTFVKDMAGEEGTLTKAIKERYADIDGLRKFSEEARGHQTESGAPVRALLARAMAAEKLVATLEDEASINFLSAKGVLPKYGFPIDTVSLNIISGNNEEAKKIDLSRDLKMAISEFAPPAKIVANGKIWESYAINTVPDKGWPTYIYYECPKCGRIYPPEDGVIDVTANLNDAPRKECVQCDTLLNPRKFIIPLFGFSTQMDYKPKPVGDARPSTYYSTQTQFWETEELTEKQRGEVRNDSLIFSGKTVDIHYSPGGKLFVLNQGTTGKGIRICYSCGYAHDPKTRSTGKHDTKFKRPCSNRNLITASLGHVFSTDILKIKLPCHGVHITAGNDTGEKDLYLSLLYAILEGASRALDISRDDINGCVSGDSEIILFDDTAGGSGFVKHIYANFRKVLTAARNKVSGACGCTPETSCYGCLRNYSNQYFHDRISRGLALEYINWLLSEDEEIDNATIINTDIEDTNEITNNETIGTRQSNYTARDTSSEDDTYSVLNDYMNITDDDSEKKAYKKLLDALANNNVEHPLTCDRIQLRDGEVWPEVFWGNSRVALFTKEKQNQYELLKTYDWYCYLLDESINAELVISHLKEEE